MRNGQDFRSAGEFTGALSAQSSHSGAIALLLLSLAVPSTLTIYLGDSKFYLARLVIIILLVPASLLLLRKGRRLVIADLFMTLASVWMIAAILIAGRYDSLSSVLAVFLEFWGGYVVARGFIFGRPAIEAYVDKLKPVVVIVVLAAMMDHVSGYLVLNSLIGPLVGVPLDPTPEYRAGLMRAMSVFPHPILYGTFCAAAGAVFLYARQWAFAVLSLFGCVLSMSSMPLLVFGIVIGVYGYDTVLNRYSWRWQLLVAIVAGFFAVIFVVTTHPTSWVIAHLTFDPSTGYFRQATWDRAFYNIGLSPLTGYGFDEIGTPVGREFFDNVSVDAVWLVLALRFGLPIVPLLLLANICSFYGGARKRRIRRTFGVYMNDLQTGFTLAIWVLMLAGLTVHYWNTLWLFWGVCLGIRAGFQEGYGAGRAGAASLLPRPYANANLKTAYRR
ncbi:conserved membrane hypothetical protein [Hyphomicrobiales bacterium]|nr:conserved membrane hypothetical protein [Hyphomicrobiales bacterium]CAH1699175.1 conserved membrane hypothetical protein [Hyphomicrobiales bacterium]CAI0342961.1 conserved membrane hypothetical protein [Hyphomicrobiales bacterium]